MCSSDLALSAVYLMGGSFGVSQLFQVVVISFTLIDHSTLFQKSWSLPRYSLANFSLALMFFLDSEDFLLVHLPFRSNLCSLFVMLDALLHQQWHQLRADPVMKFWGSFSILRSALGLNLLRWPGQDMLAVVLNLFHLQMIFWTEE